MPGAIPDVPGISVRHDVATEIMRELNSCLDKGNAQFPGAQPVSFEFKHFDALLADDYWVCEKSDGVRCLMYACEVKAPAPSQGERNGRSASSNGQERWIPAVYLVTRKNEVFYLPHFFLPSDPGNAKFYVARTILDGELLYDIHPNGSRQMWFMTFDSLLVNGKETASRPLLKRIGYVLNPYRKAMESRQPRSEILRKAPFKIALKKMELAYAIDKMFKEVIPSLKHGNDGLIFTSVNAPYIHGSDPYILKWKPASESTVDFKLEVTRSQNENSGYQYYGYVGTGRYRGEDTFKRVAQMLLNETLLDELPPHIIEDHTLLTGRIVEAFRQPDAIWRGVRWRDDKSTPNYVTIYENVLETIINPVSKSDLLERASAIRDAWYARHARE